MAEFLGTNGQLSSELDTWLKQLNKEEISKVDIYRLMINLVQGSRLAFDRE